MGRGSRCCASSFDAEIWLWFGWRGLPRVTSDIRISLFSRALATMVMGNRNVRAAPASVPRPATAAALRPASTKPAPRASKETEKKAGVNQEYDSFMEEMKGLGAL